MYPYAERDIKVIEKHNRATHLWFAASVPGAIWAIDQLTRGGSLEKLAHAIQTNTTQSIPPLETLTVTLAVAAWFIPFELSEASLAKMKQSIRDYFSRSGEAESPIPYSPIIRGVNAVMKIAHDRTPLP